MWAPTVSAGVAKDLDDILVGGVLAQSAHDVGHLVVGHLAVTNSVKETKSLLEVCGKARETCELEVSDANVWCFLLLKHRVWRQLHGSAMH